MKLSEISKELNNGDIFDIVCIQGSNSIFYLYGSAQQQIDKELNLLQYDENTHSLKIAKKSIDKVEAHFQSNNYTYLILELTQIDNDEFNIQHFTVTRGTNAKFLGKVFDNKNKKGNYPKKRRNLVEIISDNQETPDLKITDETIEKKSLQQTSPNQELQLTAEQKEVLNQINDWISSSNRIGILIGRAGSGKTTLINFLIQILSKRKKSFKLLAPTGRAARILGIKTGKPTSTIHSSIYQFDDNSLKISDDSEIQQKSFEEFDFKFDFTIKSDDDLPNIYIIDESSMISDVEQGSKELNFGSGRLLNDLMSISGNAYKKNSNTKILFVGDEMQLPPIRGKSSALDKEYLLKTFSLKDYPQVFQLNTVMRQQKNSLVLKNAENLRLQIAKNNKETFKFLIDNNQVTQSSIFKLKEKTINENYFRNRILITRSNKDAFGFNKSLREERFGKEESKSLQVGDQIIVTLNNLKFGCFNGDIFSVVEILNSKNINVELKKAKRYVNHPKVVNLNFKKITICPIEYDKNPKFYKDIVICENLLFKSDPFLNDDEKVSLYVDWNNRIRNLNLNNEEKKQHLLNDQFVNSVLVKFAYAITCHRAQGGEWENVSVLLPGIRNNQDWLRWAYTAITRSTSSLSLLNLNNNFTTTNP